MRLWRKRASQEELATVQLDEWELHAMRGLGYVARTRGRAAVHLVMLIGSLEPTDDEGEDAANAYAVTKAVERLRRRRFVTVTGDGDVWLTRDGQAWLQAHDEPPVEYVSDDK